MDKYADIIKELRENAEALNLMRYTGTANLCYSAANIIEELDYKYQRALIDIAKNEHNATADLSATRGGRNGYEH